MSRHLTQSMMELIQARAIGPIRGNCQMWPSAKNPMRESRQHITRTDFHKEPGPSIVHGLDLSDEFHRTQQMLR